MKGSLKIGNLPFFPPFCMKGKLPDAEVIHYTRTEAIYSTIAQVVSAVSLNPLLRGPKPDCNNFFRPETFP